MDPRVNQRRVDLPLIADERRSPRVEKKRERSVLVERNTLANPLEAQITKQLPPLSDPIAIGRHRGLRQR